MNGSTYRVATRDELWVEGRLLERRLSHGEAALSGGGLIATDKPDEALLETVEAEMEKLRNAAAFIIETASRVRLISETRSDGCSSHLIIRERSFSIVTTSEDARVHYELLRSISSVEPEGHFTGYSRIPIVWRNGSAAVLLHEAVGHAAEYGDPPLPWPSWLRVTDGDTDLLSGEAPAQWRRASFRDVPLRRMQSLVVRQAAAPFELPERRVEVLLVDGGGYEPLGEMVTVRVAAADLIAPDGVRRLEPFQISESRAAVARSLAGATGDPVTYPGVVCSKEGQELVVASMAPVIVTVF